MTALQHFQPQIKVRRADFMQALQHGMELWFDGSTPTKRLDQRGGRNGFTRYVNARIEGKLAEVAFRNYLYEAFGIQAGVDWRIYGSYEQTDHGDMQFMVGEDNESYEPAVEFDIKKTKPYNSWLAVRENIFQQHPDDAPFILAKLSLEDDLELDEWEDNDEFPHDDGVLNYKAHEYVKENLPVEVQLVGAAYKDEFTDTFEQGDRFYDPETGRKLGGEMRADNRGIHVDDIPSSPERWNRVVSDIVGDRPIRYHEL